MARPRKLFRHGSRYYTESPWLFVGRRRKPKAVKPRRGDLVWGGKRFHKYKRSQRTAGQISHAKYMMGVGRRHRREDIKRYGSVYRARATRKRERDAAWLVRPPSASGLWSYWDGAWTPMG